MEIKSTIINWITLLKLRVRDGNKCVNNIQTEIVKIVEPVFGVRNV